MKPIGIYIHIPFCVQKCAYCDFLSRPAAVKQQKDYIETLKREISRESCNYHEYKVQTVFFGGGTPSILDGADIADILSCLHGNFAFDDMAEVTLETNPKTADYDKLMILKNAGVNRLSIGLQSADNEELKLLGRIHTYEEFLQTYHYARAAGFGNINVDLMSALPGQGMESWICTLEKVIALQPEHISAYSLIIEEGTRLYDRLDEYPPLPDEDEDRQMYQTAKQVLAKNGYQRYEISNYAKKGYECRHNLIYWQRGARHTANYVGFGLGAASMVENVRWKNTEDINEYIQKESLQISGKNSIKKEICQLSLSDCMEEFMFLGLRTTEGISKSEFAESFGQDIDKVYGNVLYKWIKQGMLLQEGDFIRLTDAGIDVSNVVLADFLLHYIF